MVLAGLYLAGFVVLAAIALRGSDFYRTPLVERAHHEGYWQWKAGGSIGHKLGVVGSSMMVLMLLYSVRKRVGLLRAGGPAQPLARRATSSSACSARCSSSSTAASRCRASWR